MIQEKKNLTPDHSSVTSSFTVIVYAKLGIQWVLDDRIQGRDDGSERNDRIEFGFMFVFVQWINI